MISKMHFYQTPYFRHPPLRDEEMRLLLKKVKSLRLTPSKIFKERKKILDLRTRNSNGALFNYKKMERYLMRAVFQALRDLDSSIKMKECGKIEILQYTDYAKGSFFHWHRDNYLLRRNKNNNRVFTIVMPLNDSNEYRGGDLEICDYTGKVFKFKKLKKGEVVIFPADYVHRVTRVISGERKTLVAWIVGKELTSMHSLDNS